MAAASEGWTMMRSQPEEMKFSTCPIWVAELSSQATMV